VRLGILKNKPSVEVEVQTGIRTDPYFSSAKCLPLLFDEMSKVIELKNTEVFLFYF
jgi:hypothetical protein